ncbi:Cu(I)/Ag(I) efflux system membrane fusion protein [Lewinella marina]|uniref:Efflux transporter periplasmic adaptor subunit n=1 Tax=Neolewinella marina TaxID=438751 RepID=A0A2G0CHI1_9BACT|nr:efflux RND transporter periplasmic adaptor subunit [Neolewinella marina]NJB86088.1 Cu(I)/Ag(I) efflux system membrane fusion protein [Neolewinella marina]PHK99434.1 efflux transporter periplasmic adaptor subunit [Neolewinella marina]
MKIQVILYILLALLIGLFGGYLLFSGTEAASATAGAHDHGAEGTTWTCSMHPQIQRDEPGDCPICGMDLIPLETGVGSDPTILTMTEAAVALARVRTTTVGGSAEGPDAPGPDTRRLTGRLALDEQSTQVQAINYPGRLERLRITYPGEQVTAGQRIATIYSPELVVAQQELLEARRLQELSPELLVAARNKLRNLKITDEQIAQIEQSGEVITDFPVYAERSGTVLEVRARVGDYVSAGQALYTLTNLSQLWALFDAYERDLAAVDVGDRVTFTVASLPGEEFTARVTFIDPLINPATRTASIRAEVANRRGKLKPEMFITGTIETGSPRSGSQAATELYVPRTAVLWTGNRSVVYVEVPDAEVPTYQFREVELGAAAAGGYQVLSGLERGERVVTNGVFQIDAAAQLNNQSSMMNRDVVIRGREPGGMTAMTLPDFREQTPAPFRDQLTAVAEAYLPLKDRMVASQPADEDLLLPLRSALARVDMSLLEDQPHQFWMEQFNALNSHLGALAGAEELEEQRREFGFLSQALINTLTAFGANDTLYVQHCPMAFDNEGANWLSADPAIRNPYFGDAMLTCGSTLDTLTQ